MEKPANPERKVRLKIGVLGIVRGYWFVRAIDYSPAVELAALCARDRKKLETAAENWKAEVPLYTSYEEMLAADIDAVIVATPVPRHARHAIAALQAGKHVLSEVPAASTLEDCYALLQAVKSSGCKYMLAENFCYMRPWSLVKRLAKAGLFGEVFYGEGRLLAQVAFTEPQAGHHWQTEEWAMRKGHQYSTHYLGPLCQVLGERISRVSCLGSGQHYHPWARADDTSVLICSTESGKLINLRVDFFSERPDSGEGLIEIQGTRGCCRIRPGAGNQKQEVYFNGVSGQGKWQSLWDYSEYLGEEWENLPEKIITRTFDSGLPLLIEDFARSILNNRKPAIDIIAALNLTAPGLMSEISSNNAGASVKVPAFNY